MSCAKMSNAIIIFIYLLVVKRKEDENSCVNAHVKNGYLSDV